MKLIAKAIQPDLFIEKPEDVEKLLMEVKKKNYTRRINFMFGELDKIRSELSELGLYEEIQKTP